MARWWWKYHQRPPPPPRFKYIMWKLLIFAFHSYPCTNLLFQHNQSKRLSCAYYLWTTSTTAKCTNSVKRVIYFVKSPSTSTSQQQQHQQQDSYNLWYRVLAGIQRIGYEGIFISIINRLSDSRHRTHENGSCLVGVHGDPGFLFFVISN